MSALTTLTRELRSAQERDQVAAARAYQELVSELAGDTRAAPPAARAASVLEACGRTVADLERDVSQERGARADREAVRTLVVLERDARSAADEVEAAIVHQRTVIAEAKARVVRARGEQSRTQHALEPVAAALDRVLTRVPEELQEQVADARAALSEALDPRVWLLRKRSGWEPLGGEFNGSVATNLDAVEDTPECEAAIAAGIKAAEARLAEVLETVAGFDPSALRAKPEETP